MAVKPLGRSDKEEIRMALEVWLDETTTGWDVGFNDMTPEEQSERLGQVRKIREKFERLIEKIDYLYICMPEKKEKKNVEKV